MSAALFGVQGYRTVQGCKWVRMCGFSRSWQWNQNSKTLFGQPSTSGKLNAEKNQAEN